MLGGKCKVYSLLFGILIIASCQSPQKREEKKALEKSFVAYQSDWSRKSEEILVKDNAFKKNDIGFVLYDPETKKVLKNLNGDDLFTPASVMKVLTGFYTLNHFSPDHHFITSVKKIGTIKDKFLDGAIFLVGGGDPLLFTNELMQMCVDLKKQVNVVKGKFFYDETLYQSRVAIEDTQKDEDSYNTALSSLSSDFNLFDFHYRYEEKTNTLTYFYYPDVGQTFRPGTNFDAYDLEHTDWEIPRDLKTSGKEQLPLRNAGLATAKKFQMLCGKIGLKLPDPEPRATPSFAQEMVSHKSLSLREILSLGMEYSNNLVFESLLLNSAKKSTLKEAAESMQIFFAEKIKIKDKIQINNGSGLAHDNKLSPRFLLEVFKLWGDDHIAYMPISGVKGTLAKRMLEPPMPINVWAKTGTMDYVSSLAGTLFTKSGKKLTFVIMSNNKSNYVGPKEWWNNRARTLQDQLLELWHNDY